MSLRDNKSMELMVELFACANHVSRADAWGLAECAYECGIGEGIKKTREIVGKVFDEAAKKTEAEQSQVRE